MGDLARRCLLPLALAAAVACPAFLAGLWFDSMALRLAAKPWIHVLLVAWVLGERETPYGRRVAVALVLCMVADFLLEFRATHFVHGMAFFLAGQVAFASAFTMRTGERRALASLPFAVWLATAYLVIAPGLGALRVPVIAYMGAIGLMMWRAAACVAARVGDDVDGPESVAPGPGGTAGRAAVLALGGAVVFGASDTLIALDRFHAPIDGARYVIIVTYWAALALIAASAVRVARSR